MLVAKWRERLAALPDGLRVGVCWRSGLTGAGRMASAGRLEDWGALLVVPGVQWINLQYDDARDEIAAARTRWGITLHQWTGVDLKNDLEGAAALTTCLDLVISAGTSVAEMAGALGVPVWRLSQRNEWSALGAECRPWYPSMRLVFPTPGDEGFASALTTAARDLTALRPPVPTPPKAPPPPVGKPDALFSKGMELHRAGDLVGAEAHYRAVLAQRNGDADAAHLLGMIATATGRHAEAIDLFERAIKVNRRAPDYHANLAYALYASGRWGEAVDTARRALKLKSDHPQAANTMGNAYAAEARWREAASAYRSALRGVADYPEALANLGVALAAMGEDDEGLAILRRALARLPLHAPAWGAMAETLFRGAGRAEAAKAYRRQLALQPGNPAAWEGLGRVVEALGGLSGVDGTGSVAWSRAARLAPELPEAWNHLGVTARFAGRGGEAGRRFRNALALAPGAAGNLSNMALACQDAGDGPNAGRLFARALVVDPGEGLARFNQGLMGLGVGDWGRGWNDHDGRLDAPAIFRSPPLPYPFWRGEDLAERHILVWREQGLGDELMHSALYPALIQRAGRVTIAAEPRLVGLFTRSFPTARVVALADAIKTPDDGVDFQIAAGSLPGRLANSLSGMSPPPGWLTPEPDHLSHWRERVDALGDGLKIGFAWTSRKLDQGRVRAYSPLSVWEPLFQVPGTRWISLQYDGREDELAVFRRFEPVVFRDADLMNDLETAAALTAACDLVIGVASSVGEMAGALGVPVWRLGARDWTWLGTGARPWFPTMRVWAPCLGEAMDGVPVRMARALTVVRTSGREGESR